jgi:uncharacterized protein
MTALRLLELISLGLLCQLGVGVGLFFWHRRRPARAGVPDQATPDAARIGAWSGWREFRVLRRQHEDAAKSQCSFHLQPVDGAALPPFRPGQYLTVALQVGDGQADGTPVSRRLKRCYSISDRPDPAGYRITVKRSLPPADRPELPPGAVSSLLHDHVAQGAVLQVRAPAGQFFIDPDAAVPAVFVAGGIGITPMMSMLRWCVAEQPDRPLYLFYGVRGGGDHAFKSELEALARAHPALRLHGVYSQPGPGDVQGVDYQHVGHIDLALLRSSLPSGRHQFYVCGPPAMMQNLVPALRAWGVPESDLHHEAFGPASLQRVGSPANHAADGAEVSLSVRFSRSGRTLIWDGRDANLLDFAERHGVAIDSGCRSGSCGSCETALASGVVEHAGRPDHEVASGHCLLCVGTPTSDVELEA